MKKIYSFLTAILLLGKINAQAPLPTSENFTGFTGTFVQPGWTFNNAFGTAFTYATGQSGVAGRLDATNDYVEVFTAAQIGTITYYLKGQSSNGTFLGTFKLRESTNGTTWNDLTVLVDAQISGSAFTQYSATPAPASRYIRFEFTNKISGYNIAIDEINMAAGVPVAQDINVKQGTNTILSGGTTSIFSSPVSTPTNVNFILENIGLATLNVSSIVFTGSAATDFTVSNPATPFSVGAQANSPITVVFTPSVSGTRQAIMTINSDDPDEAAYVINLYGVGGTLASEPVSQGSNLSFTNIKSYRATVNFTAASPAPDGYLILRKNSSSPITDVPVDGVEYKKGDLLGSSKVVYSADVNSFALFNVYANSTYQIAVYAYNGNGTFTNYNTASPLSGSFTSSVSMMPPTEYSGISPQNANFVSQLSAHVNPHTAIFYSNYDETMVRMFEARDTANAKRAITCAYSGHNEVYNEPFDWTNQDFSREHTFCHSWMPTFPADNPEKPEYNDQHNLYPVRFTDVNSERSNYPLGDVITVQNAYLQAVSGQNANGNKVYEPRDQQKGNAARAIFYMCIAYYTTSANWHLPSTITTTAGTLSYTQDQNVLKAWHYQDLPDNYEISRNDFIDSIQGNRNPFIDSVDWVCYIDFTNMTLIPNATAPCNQVSVKETYNLDFDFELFPNPAKSNFSVLLKSDKSEDYTIRVRDISGREVYSSIEYGKVGKSYFYFSDMQAEAGVYFVELSHGDKKLVKKLVIQ